MTLIKQAGLAVAGGAAATATMDALNALASKAGLVFEVNHVMIGNLMSGWLRGQFFYASPREVTGPNSFAWGMAVHLAIGIAFAAVFLFCVNRGWLRSKAAMLAFGVGTSVFSLFYLFPCVGMGVMALHMPTAGFLIRSSLLNHLFFGLGLMAFGAWLNRRRVAAEGGSGTRLAGAR